MKTDWRAVGPARSPGGDPAAGGGVDRLVSEMAPGEHVMLARLRSKRRANRDIEAAPSQNLSPTLGQNIADKVAATMGSWPFIIIQTTILALWITLNVIGWRMRWDPFPFILLNLALSFQAAYAAPFIMMSQNRQRQLDRKQAGLDYQINVKAELEIELLHQKVDELKEREILVLAEAVEELVAMLDVQRKAPVG